MRKGGGGDTRSQMANLHQLTKLCEPQSLAADLNTSSTDHRSEDRAAWLCQHQGLP